MPARRGHCPTPYKEAYLNMGEALEVQKRMRQRNKRGKTKSQLKTPYRCQCGRVHFTATRRGTAKAV